MSEQQKQDMPTEEERKRAFDKNAQLKIYQLYQLAEIINLASTRGAFRGQELTHVGGLFDKLSAGVDSAFKMAQAETKAETEVEATKLETIPEVSDEAVSDEVVSDEVVSDED